MINMHLRIWLMPQKAMKTFCRQPDLMTDIQPTSTPGTPSTQWKKLKVDIFLLRFSTSVSLFFKLINNVGLLRLCMFV